MKKCMAMLLALILALGMGTALAAKGDANLARNIKDEYMDGIQSLAVLGDTLYVLGWQNFYTWKSGEEDVSMLPLEELEAKAGESPRREYTFGDGEKLYSLNSVFRVDENMFYTLERAELCELEVSDGTVKFTNPVDVNIDELTVNYGGNDEYLKQINQIVAFDGTAYLLGYNDAGTYFLYALDMQSGEGEYIDVENAEAIVPYKDGCLLICSYDYNMLQVGFDIYDPDSESFTPACEPYESQYGAPRGIVYSEQSDRLLYSEEGYVKAVTDFDFENAQKVAEMSLSVSSQSVAQLLPGDYYVAGNYDSVSVRNTLPDAMPERFLVVNCSYLNAADEAYYDFTARHDDVGLVMKREYYEDSSLISAMMNRDSSVDVYVMSVNSQAFDALYNRGYLAELTEPELLSRAERMYPFIQEAIMKDGALLAMPVEIYGWNTALNIPSLEKMGYTRDQIPTNWIDFLKFLPELYESLPEDGSIRLLDSWMSQSEFKHSFVRSIIKEYESEMSAQGIAPDYKSSELREALELVMSMDGEALGLPEEFDPEIEEAIQEYARTTGNYPIQLMETDMGCTPGNYYSMSRGSEPWLMSVGPEGTPTFPLELSVVFVNPFSQNYELAQEFVLDIVKNEANSVAYCVSDELNEPARSKYYEANMREFEKTLENLRAEYESADPVDKPDLEEYIKSIEANVENYRANDWEVTPESIAWYRSVAPNITVAAYNPLNSDPSGESYQLLQQLIEGTIDVATYLDGIGQKAHMMALEGN